MKFKAYHERLPAKAREAYRRIDQAHTMSSPAQTLENKCLQTVYLRNAEKILPVRDYRFVRKAFANPSLATAEEARKAEANPGRKIIKFGDGHMMAAIAFGEGVKEVIKLLRKKRISMRNWLLQDLILPNTMEVEDCEGPYRGFVDLSVYASYAFSPSKPAGQRLEHFSVSGYDCSARADGKDYFNYNSGVPVLVSR